MPACCAFGCNNRSSTKSIKQRLEEEKIKISFHKFPKNPERRNTWVKAIRRVGWIPTDTSVVCSAHFADEYFDRTSLQSIRLREKAMPTIFPSFPTYLQKKETKSRSPPLQRNIPGITRIQLDEPQPCTSQQSDEFPSPIEEPSRQIQIAAVDKSTTSRNIRKLFSRITSFSPLRKSRRELSPMKAELRNKLNQMKIKYQRKIKLLQQTRRRHVQRIASLENMLNSIKTNNNRKIRSH